MPKLAKNIFSSFDLCLSSSKETKDYLTKLDAIPSGVAYTKAASDLPAASTIQNLFSGDNAIGTIPETDLPSAGSDDPSVIHGKTIHSPPAN